MPADQRAEHDENDLEHSWYVNLFGAAEEVVLCGVDDYRADHDASNSPALASNDQDGHAEDEGEEEDVVEGPEVDVGDGEDEEGDADDGHDGGEDQGGRLLLWGVGGCFFQVVHAPTGGHIVVRIPLIINSQ